MFHFTLVLILVSLCACFAEETSTMIPGIGKPEHECCLKESGLTNEELVKTDRNNVPEKVYCYTKCIENKAGFLNDNGEFNLEKYMNLPLSDLLTEEKRSKLVECIKGLGTIKTCMDMKKMEDCDYILFGN